jgi:hypothetical protein
VTAVFSPLMTNWTVSVSECDVMEGNSPSQIYHFHFICNLNFKYFMGVCLFLPLGQHCSCYPFRVISAKFGTCTVVSVNGTLVESKMCLESTHFIFNKCPIYTHDGANANFSTNSHETDYSVVYSPDNMENGDDLGAI